jgi:hypothetical protein
MTIHEQQSPIKNDLLGTTISALDLGIKKKKSGKKGPGKY